MTHENRGSSGGGLRGEKKDVRVWLGWLELYANGEVEAIESPIGMLPKYDDLQKLFSSIGKEYPKALYEMQFAIYIDNIVKRIDLQTKEYSKENSIPPQLYDVYRTQKEQLLSLKEKFGAIVSINDLA